jgi:nucleolar protein 15
VVCIQYTRFSGNYPTNTPSPVYDILYRNTNTNSHQNKIRNRKKMEAGPKLSSRKVVEKKKVQPTVPNSARGVVHISKLPHEFGESELRKFYGQFGTISKLRLSRSTRTARSRGYAYIRFQLPEVAKIAVEATHNYIIAGKPIMAEVIEPEAVHPELFKGHNRKFIDRRLIVGSQIRKKHNSKRHMTLGESTLEKDSERRSKLEEAGVEYEYTRKVVATTSA